MAEPATDVEVKAEAERDVARADAVENASDDGPFDLDVVTTLFNASRQVDGVQISSYVQAFRELNKFFAALGRLFVFMASDVADKTSIVAEHVRRDTSLHHYDTVASMLDFEQKQGIASSTLYTRDADGTLPSGSRTLLRLHRALQFVIQFIDGVRLSAETDRIGPVARSGYDQTLGQYHPWLIRQGVHLALYSLPNRKQLIKTIAGDLPQSQANAMMEQAVAVSTAVYDQVQKLYAEREMLDLP